MILPDAPRMTSHDLVAMLRRHYLPDGRPPGGIFAGEIESPDGRRRADALWCPWTISGGSGLIGHEVKVTRADVITELADPTKADPWARYCVRWWLVVASPSLVDGLAIPEAWGIMAPPSGRRRRTMTVLREAPALKPHDTGPAWRRVAAWADLRTTTRIRDLEWRLTAAERDRDHARTELATRQDANLGRGDARGALIGRILTALDHEPRSGWGDRLDVDEVVAAIQDVRAARRLASMARSEVDSLVREVRRIAAPMSYVADELARVTLPPTSTSEGETP